ncbi:hypothetical protein SinmeB_1664 [Sinorhizobium meliloti BL225C]|nr:hypothetical protein SinmeB_1664 [Sinorhizobium meliloti BL225C]
MRVRGKEAIRRTTAFRSDRRPEHAGAALRILKGSRLPQEWQHPPGSLQAHIRHAIGRAARLSKEPAGDAAPAGAPEEITFANLPEWCDVLCKCRSCGRIDRLNRRALTTRFGKRQSILQLAPRMRCKRCENRDGNTIFIGKPRQ